MLTNAKTAVSISGLYERNLKLLAQNQPDMINELISCLNAEIKSDVEITVIESKTNLPIIKYGDLLLNSAYDPIKEAQRFVDALEFDQFINIAVLGLGMGYHLDEIVEKSQKRDFILVVEKDINLFKKFLENRDLAKFYNSCKIYFAVARKPMDIFRALQGCSLTIFSNGLTVVKHPSSVKIDPDYYDEIGEKIKDIFQWSRVNTISQINASNDFADNIFANMPHYLDIPGIKQLFGKFAGFPGIVVSAGPSLIKNIRYLKEAQGKSLIIAVDTALRVLLRHNIQPDIIVSIDYTKHNKRYFDGIPDIDSALAVDPEVYPQIIDDYKGPKFMISLPGKSLCDWLEDTVEDKGGMDKGLSVAHTAFLLAMKLGLTPVGFVGQDLSFPGNMSHVRGSAMVRKSNVKKDQAETTFVKDYFNGAVVTTTSMHVFLRHFEDLIDKHKIECYDLTEGGAYISGANPMPLREFIMLKTAESRDTKKIIAEAYNEKVVFDKKRFFSKLDKTISGFKYTANLAEEGKNLIKKLQKRIIKKDSNYNLSKLLKQWSDISTDLHRQRDVFLVLGNNITDIMLLQSKKDDFNLNDLDEKNVEKILPYLNKEEIIYTRLAEQCDIFYKKFTELKGKIPDLK